MTDRFHHPPPWGDVVQLAESEGRHLARVLRKQPGEMVELFDGWGQAARAMIVKIRRSAVTLRIEERFPPSPMPQPAITIAVASPKGERLRWMIEKLAELGVDRIIPLSAERSVVEPGEQKLSRLQLALVAACKQSGRNRIPELDEPCPLGQLAERVPLAACRILLGDPAGRPLPALLFSCEHPVVRTAGLLAVIGPEGGFTEAEIGQVESWGGQRCRLAEGILRIETAAIAVAAQLAGWRLRHGSVGNPFAASEPEAANFPTDNVCQEDGST